MADQPPNIIFIMADDMGYGDAGCYGQTHIQTPNIDRLATEGMRFTQCYSGSPVCAPARSVLMTGLHTGHTRVRGNFGIGGVKGLGGADGRVPLLDEDVTVAEVLKPAKYTTGIVGKWGLGEPSTTGTPNRQGFDFWFGYLNQRRAHSHFPTFLWLNEFRFDLPGNENNQEQQYSHDLFTGFALHFIRKNKSKPFFLYVPYTVPHAKFHVPDLGPYANKPWKANEKSYAAMITRMDQHIGRIMKLLSDLEIDDNTLVFFCSDNGAADRYDGLFDSSGPLRGRKRDMYEGGIRTPMIARWPKQIPAGTVNPTAWTFADFLPTAAAAAKTVCPAGLDGTSVLPTLLGEKQPEFEDRFLYWEFFERGFQQAARWKDWKFVRHVRTKRKDGNRKDDAEKRSRDELFNLANDLSEKHNVADKHPEIVKKFSAFLKTARTESKAWPSEGSQ